MPMMKTCRVLAILGLLALSGPGHATRVYKSTAPDGSTVFSDRPSPSATPIDLAPSPAAPPAAPSAEKPAPPPASAPVVYKTLRITQPADDAVAWFASGPVAVSVEVVPPLAEGHVLVPLLNDVPQGDGVGGNGFNLTGLDPDTYRLAVEIRDAAGKTLKRSPTIRFHFKRQSVNLPARRPRPPDSP